MWQCALAGESLGAALCGQAGMTSVWLAMNMARQARQLYRELKVHHAAEIIGSLMPKVVKSK